MNKKVVDGMEFTVINGISQGLSSGYYVPSPDDIIFRRAKSENGWVLVRVKDDSGSNFSEFELFMDPDKEVPVGVDFSDSPLSNSLSTLLNEAVGGHIKFIDPDDSYRMDRLRRRG